MSIVKDNYTYVSASDVQDAFRILFRVWEGTENAEQILEDAARTIGHNAFGIQAEGGALNAFVALCQEGAPK